MSSMEVVAVSGVVLVGSRGYGWGSGHSRRGGCGCISVIGEPMLMADAVSSLISAVVVTVVVVRGSD